MSDFQFIDLQFTGAQCSEHPLEPLWQAAGGQCWNPDWLAFRQKHPDFSALTAECPLYALPKATIKAMARTENKVAVFSKAAAKAEEEFTELCDSYRAIGVWKSERFLFDLLSPALKPSAADLRRSKLNPVAVRETLRISEARKARTKGVMGWLLTEPTYLQQVKSLEEQWRNLGADVRPRFPLDRIQRIQSTANPPPGNFQSFALALNAFLDRWGLTHLATWDLPVPQGPLINNPLPPSAVANPHHGVHIFLPVHFPLQAKDDIWREIIAFQKQAAKSCKIDDSFAGLPHSDAYASIFDVLHLERAILLRFQGQIPHGSISRIETAVASGLDISVDLVQKCRKAISSCRRGLRQRLRWLKPPVR